MKKYYSLLTFWLVNSFLIYFGMVLLQGDVVLGTYWLPSWGAAIFSGLWLTLLNKTVSEVLKYFNVEVKGLAPMLIGYFVTNFIALWVIARLSPFTGFGITRFYWAGVLAIIFTIAQWIVTRLIEETKPPAKKRR